MFIIYVYNCYIFLMNGPSCHYITSLIVSCNSFLALKSVLSDISISEQYIFSLCLLFAWSIFTYPFICNL